MVLIDEIILTNFEAVTDRSKAIYCGLVGVDWVFFLEMFKTSSLQFQVEASSWPCLQMQGFEKSKTKMCKIFQEDQDTSSPKVP